MVRTNLTESVLFRRFIAKMVGLFYQIINGQHSRSQTSCDVGQVPVNGLHMYTFGAVKNIMLSKIKGKQLYLD